MMYFITIIIQGFYYNDQYGNKFEDQMLYNIKNYNKCVIVIKAFKRILKNQVLKVLKII